MESQISKFRVYLLKNKQAIFVNGLEFGWILIHVDRIRGEGQEGRGQCGGARGEKRGSATAATTTTSSQAASLALFTREIKQPTAL